MQRTDWCLHLSTVPYRLYVHRTLCNIHISKFMLHWNKMISLLSSIALDLTHHLLGVVMFFWRFPNNKQCVDACKNLITFPWLVVQLNPRFFASSPQSNPFLCKSSAVSREGIPSSCKISKKIIDYALKYYMFPCYWLHRISSVTLYLLNQLTAKK